MKCIPRLIDVLRALGAEIVRTPSLAGYDAPGETCFFLILVLLAKIK
jgi:hypothetical protein